ATSMPPTVCGGAPGAGYQALGFSAGPFPLAVSGDQGVFHITYATGGPTGTFTLEGRGSATSTDLNHNCSNTAQIQVTVQADAALTASKTFTPAAVQTGSPSSLKITIMNSNAFAASGAAFTDTYPAGLVN